MGSKSHEILLKSQKVSSAAGGHGALEGISPAADDKPVAVGKTPEINSRQRAPSEH